MDMRLAEACANTGEDIDDEVVVKFQEKMRDKIKTRLPGFIRSEFFGQILSQNYERDRSKLNAVMLDWWSPELAKAINAM
jgi:hypothetical protein